MTKAKIKLSFTPSPDAVMQKIYTKQSDSLTRSIEVSLINNGVPFVIPNGCVTVLRGTGSDGNIFELAPQPDVDAENGILRFVLDEAVLSIAGDIICDVVCMWISRGEYMTYSTELFVIKNVSSAVDPNSEEMKREILTVPSVVNLALGSAKASGEFDGTDGASAYEIALDNGFYGSEGEWLASLKGEKGDRGVQGLQGVRGEKGDKGDAFTYDDFTPEQLASLKGDKGDKGEQGIQGEKGEKGASGTNGKDGVDGKDGHTPVKGVDYWTESDMEAVAADISAEVASQLAGRAQLAPEFADSVEECIDTSKMYVLPDGYIYAYTGKTTEDIVKPEFTNRLPLSVDTDGTVYNDKGYLEDSRVNSSGGVVSATGIAVTGFIPIGYGSASSARGEQVIYLQGIEALPENTNIRIAFYAADKTYIVSQGIAAWKTPSTDSGSSANVYTVDADGYIDSIDISGYTGYLYVVQSKETAFFRICLPGIDNESIITVNEEISYTTVEGGTDYGWTNTGHAFVPADYEERISENETDILLLNNRIAVLESGGASSGVKSYVTEEAERVAKAVYSKQNANTFTFSVISDMHYLAGHSDIVASNIHAGQGMDLVRKGVNVDFAVCLGDIGWGSGVADSSNRATIEMGIEEIRSANKCIDSAFRGIPNFRAVGNHDSLIYNYTFNENGYLDSSKLFPLYGAYNRGAIFPNGEKERGYCYRDFDNWKLRVICMNTSDIQDLTPSDSTPDVYVSGTQGKWFAESLDLSEKADSSEWSILIFSHAPLDWGRSCIYLCDILKAYIDGGSCKVTRDGVTISYDYAGKNAAAIIGNCHGHNHNFQTDNLRRLVSGNTTEAIELKRFCIPNACFTRTNEKGENTTVEILDIEYGEATSYEKTAGTAQDTAFCVVTVDTAARKIYADHYGAGYDREIDY